MSSIQNCLKNIPGCISPHVRSCAKGHWFEKWSLIVFSPIFLVSLCFCKLLTGSANGHYTCLATRSRNMRYNKLNFTGSSGMFSFIPPSSHQCHLDARVGTRLAVVPTSVLVEKGSWLVAQAGMVYASGETACLDSRVRVARGGVGWTLSNVWTLEEPQADLNNRWAEEGLERSALILDRQTIERRQGSLGLSCVCVCVLIESVLGTGNVELV